VAVGDFNGDGKLDLAVADYGSSSVSVLLGNGDGSFQAQRTFAAGNYPHSLAVGDFNGDGHLDLATSTGKILLGNGDGTFQAPTTFAAVGGSAVAVGVFTGDGDLDLAVTGPGIPNRGVGVYLGNGDGTFQAPRYNLVDLFPNALAVADFNGDGIPDLAVSGNSSVGVLLGNGDGTLQTADDYPAGPKPTAVVSGDFNGDGFPDLAVINSTNYLPNPSTVTVLLNAADGSTDHPAAARPHQAARASLTVDPLSAQAAAPDPRAARPLPSTAGELRPTPAPQAPADLGTGQPVLTPAPVWQEWPAPQDLAGASPAVAGSALVDWASAGLALAASASPGSAAGALCYAPTSVPARRSGPRSITSPARAAGRPGSRDWTSLRLAWPGSVGLPSGTCATSWLSRSHSRSNRARCKRLWTGFATDTSCQSC
jgi:hypothetical protein